MSLEKFDADCKDCRPVLMSMETGKRLPEDSPEMQAVLAVWNAASPKTREAFHRFTCLNSRDQECVELVEKFREDMQKVFAMKEGRSV